MFETVIAKITKTLRNLVTAVGTATRRSPWLAPLAILAFFLVR